MGENFLTDLNTVATFGGARIVHTGVEVETVGPPAPAILAAVARDIVSFAGAPIPVSYRVVARSEGTLDTLTDRIFSDLNFWDGQGIKLTSWGPDVDSNTVLIRLESYSSTAAAAIGGRYGNAISVYPRDVAVAGAERTDDTPPWYGGDALSLPGGGCTSFFSLYSTGNGADYNATAGHCGLGTVQSGGSIQGTVASSRVHWTNGGNTDVSVYPVASNSGRIWSGPPAGSVRGVTSRSTNDTPDTLLCTGGMVDQQVCNVRIAGVSSVRYEGKTIQNQIFAKQDLQINAFSRGDSGGPVYYPVGSYDAKAYGMIVAQVTTDPSQGWYTPQRYVLGAYSNLTFKPYR